MKNKWLDLAKELQAIAQNGLTYSKDPFDLERFNQIRKLSLNILREYINIEETKLLELFEQEKGYTTPKIDVRAAIFEDDKILLGKESTDNKWSLPGGWADINLTPKENIIKEIKEETGFEAEVERMISFEDAPVNEEIYHLFHTYKAFFLCKIVGGEMTTSIETLEVKFFACNNLPDLSEPRITQEQVERCFNYYYNPNLQAYFN